MRSSAVLWSARALVFVSSLVFAQALPAQAPIATGDLVVVRVGDGTGMLSNAATPVFLDEFTTAGAPVQSIPIPTIASPVVGTNRALTMSGTATSEGDLNLSIDGRYLLLTGYNASPGYAGVASSGTTGASPVLRVVGRVDLNGNIDTTTALTAYSGNNIRSAASFAGNDFWTAGASNSVNYVSSLGAQTSTQITTSPSTIRRVRLFAGQLYCSSASGAIQGVATIGTGLPASPGQTIALLPGFPSTSGPSTYDFFFADQSTLYVADDRASAYGGIQKWTYSAVNGVWSLAYTLQAFPNVGCRGLAGIVSGGTTTLYATTAEAAGLANHVVMVTDIGLTSTFTTLAMSGTNTVFRGISLVEPGPSVTAYGSGCPGTGNVVPALSSAQVPYFGNLGFALDVTQAAANAPAYVYGSIGTDPIGTPLGGTCTAYLNVPSALSLIAAGIFPFAGMTDGGGNATIGIPIPYAPFLSGTHVGLQAIVFDGGSSTGFTLTNALDMLLTN